jgi:hypothetical protein
VVVTSTQYPVSAEPVLVWVDTVRFGVAALAGMKVVNEPISMAETIANASDVETCKNRGWRLL